MNPWRTELIVPDRVYSFAEIGRTIGVCRTTLKEWRACGRLHCCAGRRSMTTGLWLLAAIDRRAYRSIEKRQHPKRVKAFPVRIEEDGGNVTVP